MHWALFAGCDVQGSARGGAQCFGANWLSAAGHVRWAGGELGARLMLSLEPLTVGARGYPLLLQTGESFEGEPLHDRQHPHDLFMEAALLYTARIGEEHLARFYAAPVGAPALGPVAYPHRASAASDPFAPLGHHWQDSTHISFGVLNAAVLSERATVDVSWFNGREPDERRFDFDLRPPDSFSARVTASPASSLSLQGSFGYLRSPEELEPEISVHRITASATYQGRFADEGALAVTALIGRNVPSQGPPSSAWLLEANLDADGRNTLFGRAELVEKIGHDLVLRPEQGEQVFPIGSLALGYLRRFPLTRWLEAGIGARGALNFVGAELGSYYGTRTPPGGMVFFLLRPAPPPAGAEQPHERHGAARTGR
ncbi:MAG: hypothetical protein HYZ28_04280 [Myxococcales bacterium]|nr:hypothetical protein [Myxococcales bacterium]